MDSPRPTKTTEELRLALRAGDYRAARRCARRLARIESTDLLRLMALAASKGPEDYERLAGEWIGATISEGVVQLADLQWVVPALLKVQRGKTQEMFRLLLIAEQRRNSSN